MESYRRAISVGVAIAVSILVLSVWNKSPISIQLVVTGSNFRSYVYRQIVLIRDFKKDGILNKEIEEFSQDSPPSYKVNVPQCDIGDVSKRFDCHPELLASPQKCLARGCCWKPVKADSRGVKENPEGVPWCYYPQNFPGYTVQNTSQFPFGLTTEITRNSKSYYPGDSMDLVVQVRYETDSRVRIRMIDPYKEQYEVPLSVPSGKGAQNPMYSVSVSNYGEDFSFSVKRNNGSVELLQTSGAAPLIYTDQFLQLSSFLPSRYIYGLGEHRGPLLHSVNWTRVTMWNRDQSPVVNANLYGTHPFYLVMEEDGKSHGVFLLNSNAMDVVLQPGPAVTWRTIGGILDLYVFLGPTPADVIQQYTEVIGHSFMPPYWSLGFHLCRWGYKTTNDTMNVVNSLLRAGIPQDVQWNDIDYMDKMLDFTTSPLFGDQAAMVDALHARGMHYVILVDPGISNMQKRGTYPPYDVGQQMDVFIKDYKGNPLVGKVWPGYTVFPDFTNPKTIEYWTEMVKTFHNTVSFDGLWIDMNELSSFVDGSTNKCPQNNIENPPFVPAVTGGKLCSSTVCASSKQNASINYNVHNLYGLTESQATYQALKTVRGKRPFLISRSTYAGQGFYGGHWSGDNFATFEDMYYSIPEILNFNMFGISMIGADICGFKLNSYEELCTRWHQLGAFYPFSRNHNAIGSKSQEPTAFGPAMARIVAEVYRTRYSLLPYLYTLFHKSHMMGYTVVRPLFFQFPQDVNTYHIDKQFLWGDGLMITPVLTKGASQVDAYFPEDIWYDFYTGVAIHGNKTEVTLDAPIDKINLHVRGGSILTMQEPELTTTDTRKNPFRLLVALDNNQVADGDLFWDDGDTLDTHTSGQFNMLRFYSEKQMLNCSVVFSGYKKPMPLDRVTVYGVPKFPTAVHINNVLVNYTYSVAGKALQVNISNIDLLQQFRMDW